MLLVYKHGRGTWEATPLQLPAKEELSMERTHSFHGEIHGSALYFLTVLRWTSEMSVRLVNVLDNVTGISQKVCSWSSLPPFYTNSERYHCFESSIAIVSGDVFMGYVRPVDPDKPISYTVALQVYNKQREKWDFVSKMPLADSKGGFAIVQWQRHHFVGLRSQGHTLIVSNCTGRLVFLYNTLTKVWSPLGSCEEFVDVALSLPLGLTCLSCS